MFYFDPNIIINKIPTNLKAPENQYIGAKLFWVHFLLRSDVHFEFSMKQAQVGNRPLSTQFCTG